MIDRFTKKFSIFLIFFSLFLIGYLFYKSEIIFLGHKSTYYSIYYIISFLLLFFSILLYFLNNNIRAKIILIFISIIFALYCVEGTLIFKNYLIKKSVKNTDTSIYLQKDSQGRTKLELYNQMKKKNDNINLYVPPIKLIKYKDTILPLSSKSNSQIINCNENGFFSKYSSDRYGFNNPDIEWERRNIEYLILGDSFAHGDCVNEVDSLSGQLRNLSNKNNSVISLGHSGNGPLIEYATLREYFPNKKKVNNIIWLYYEANDLINLSNEKENKILIEYLNDLNFSQNLINRQTEINKLIDDFFLEKYNLYKNNRPDNINIPIFTLLSFLKFQELRINFIDKFLGKVDPDFHNILLSTKDFAKKKKSELYFVYIPDYFRYKNKLNVQNSSKKYKKILKIVKNLNIPIIDLKKIISEKEDSLKYFSENGVHFNERGYELTTLEIFKKINN